VKGGKEIIYILIYIGKRRKRRKRRR